MQPPNSQIVNKGDIGYRFSIVQALFILLFLLIMPFAGPETETIGTMAGMGGLLLMLIATLFAPLSLIVFLVTRIRGAEYRVPTARNIVALVSQVASIAFFIYVIFKIFGSYL